jgi:Schlafen, AlbA_2
MHMLLTKPPADITWDDVQQFCERQLVESKILDYKREFPKHLENVIAAMANTQGGTIIIGVAESAQGKPLAPYEGIEFERGLQEKVQQIAASHIRPMVDLPVAIAPNGAGDRAFVVISVPTSPLAPHSVDGNAIYVRTGNRNQPEKLAAPAQIEGLFNHREKGRQEKVRLIAQANARSKARGQPVGPLLTLSLCPSYPGDALREPRELLQVYRSMAVCDGYGPDITFPIPSSPRTLQDGVEGVRTQDDSGEFYYAELACQGLYFTRQTLTDLRDGNGRGGSQIRASEIVCRVDEVLRTGNNFYEGLGYGGPLEFSFEVDRANDKPSQGGHPHLRPHQDCRR